MAGNMPRHFDGGKENRYPAGMWITQSYSGISPLSLFTCRNGKAEKVHMGGKAGKIKKVIHSSEPSSFQKFRHFFIKKF